ncbi:MAG: ATP-binding cassette domain-containing protein [Oscillospiraceae bacterium]|nr:ATP-binding cassette domain-containing protein [Oscillospiraceae bacterium]
MTIGFYGGEALLEYDLIKKCVQYADSLVEGQTIRYSIMEYRKRFSVVPQDIHLFQGTIRENIQIDGQARKKLDHENLLFCSDVVMHLESGWKTDVGSEGIKLSGGERQKIALLRALNRETDVLILDEPTSNYDAESKKQFYEFLKNEKAYGFYFVVTHEPIVLEGMDQIWLVKNGTVNVKRTQRE